MPDFETEVKIYIKNIDAIEKKLQIKGAKLVQARVFEHNSRYDLADKSLQRRGVVVRLRNDNSVRLTYKEPGTIERGIITREELEVEVSDFDTMQKILGKFGYNPSRIYEKYRTVYLCHDTYIMLDELPYGNFIEVEGKPDNIEWVLEQIGLQNAERRVDSYSKLFDHVRHHLELNFNDLTFENFVDIDVPIDAFIAPGSVIIR